MHVVQSRFEIQASSIEELFAHAEPLAPVMQRESGCVAYIVVRDGHGVSGIGIYDDPRGAAVAGEIAAAWLQRHIPGVLATYCRSETSEVVSHTFDEPFQPGTIPSWFEPNPM